MTDTSDFLRLNQASILWLLISDRNTYDKTIDQLSEDFFEGDGFKWVFRKLKEHTSKYDELPDRLLLQHYAESASSSEADSWEVENVILPTIYDGGQRHRNYIASKLDEYVQKRRAQNLVDQLKDDLNNNIDAFQDSLREWHQSESNSNHSNGAKLISVQELLMNPELTKPMARVSPWLSWEGNLSIFSAREKLGKTTLAVSDAIRATQSGKTVLWFSGDEGTRQQAVRLHQLGSNPDNFFVTDYCPRSWQDASALVAASNADVVYVDSLSTFLTTISQNVPAVNEGERWHSVVNRFREWTADGKRAVVLIHHGRKDDGTSRGSTGITAATDMNISFEVKGNQRKLKYVGRLDGQKAPTIEYRGPNQLCEEVDGLMTQRDKACAFR